ncbi:hypothetical protein [Embleya sp. NPDC020630]|uniref:hypothetical protein n=1 Tax=Embleya sp. NPDC020630 TaxID=3363979 RepID=UPI0037BDDABC
MAHGARAAGPAGRGRVPARRARVFGLDRTGGQTSALYVACENDALRAQVIEWLERAGTPVLVVRGFGSQSYVQVVRERTGRDPRPAELLYVGDFDCSGEDIERDWVARTGCWALVERVLLTGTRSSNATCPLRPAASAIRVGRRSRAGTASIRPGRCSGRRRRRPRPSCGAWSWRPSPPYVNATVLAERIAEEDRQRERLRDFTRRWGTDGQEDDSA